MRRRASCSRPWACPCGNWPTAARSPASSRPAGNEEGNRVVGMITDPIADMLTQIRNANTARHDHADRPASKMKMEIARILKDEGFIADWRFIERGPQGVLRVTLKYGPRKEPILSGL